MLTGGASEQAGALAGCGQPSLEGGLHNDVIRTNSLCVRKSSERR
jgi:hypothetical protein